MSSAQLDGNHGEEITGPEDLDIEDTQLGRMLLKRPEVRDAKITLGHECAVIFVTFRSWSIPSDFARQYDMHLTSASIVDERPRWKQVFGWGRPCWIEGRFVRNAEVSVDG